MERIIHLKFSTIGVGDYDLTEAKILEKGDKVALPKSALSRL
jgi:hypothetical protein